MKKKKKIIVTAVIAVVIGALIVLLLVFPRKKGEWVVYYPDSPGQVKPVSDSGKLLVWPQEVNEENISHIPFYRYKFRKKIEMPVVRICVMNVQSGEIVSSVDANVGYFVFSQTEPIVFVEDPSLHGKRIRGKLILYVPFFNKEIEKDGRMRIKVLEKGETS